MKLLFASVLLILSDGAVSQNTSELAAASEEMAEACVWCPNGVPESLSETMRPDSGLGVYSCGVTVGWATTLNEGDKECTDIKADEALCCPDTEATCSWCLNGVPDSLSETMRPDSGLGMYSCGATVGWSTTLKEGDKECTDIKADEALCCPDVEATCSWCPNGVPDSLSETMRPDSGLGVYSCGVTIGWATTLKEGDKECMDIKPDEGLCCPDVEATCSWCPNGVPDSLSETMRPDSGLGVYSCGVTVGWATTLKEGDKECTDIKADEALCCPDVEAMCSWCPNGVPDSLSETMRPDSGLGVYSCGVTAGWTTSLKEGDQECIDVKADEALCCPEVEAMCSWCPNGVPDSLSETMRPHSGLGVYSCGVTIDWAATLKEGDKECTDIKADEDLCCPTTCSWCPNGVPDSLSETMRPDSGLGVYTCGVTVGWATTLKEGDQECMDIKADEALCCPATCSWCTNGVPDSLSETMRPDSGLGVYSCGVTAGWAATLKEGDKECMDVKADEALCCPDVDAVQPALSAATDACTTGMCAQELEPGLNLRYQMNVPDNTISMELTYDGEAWVSIAFSPDGKMIGSESVIGLPEDGTVQKYSLAAYAPATATVLMEQQTLSDTSIEVKDGQTIMKFTKIMKEPGEIEITSLSRRLSHSASSRDRHLLSDNIFLYAYGSSPALAYHKKRNSFQLELISEASVEPPAPTPEIPPTTESPTEPPEPVAARDCFKEMCMEVLEKGLFFLEYQINVPNDSTADVCEGCAISMVVTYEGDAWVSIGFSTDGLMIGSEAVIGVTGNSVKKYNLISKAGDGAALMGDDKQTLTDTSIEFKDGQTIMKFTKIMKEPGEIEISTGDNAFIWAYGMGPAPIGYHAARSAFQLNLSSGATLEVSVPNQAAWLAHGIMAFLTWGVLVPFAVQSSLLRDLLPGGPLWFKLHRGLNTAAFTLFILTFAVGVAYVVKEEGVHFDNDHEKMGLAMFILAVMQVGGGVFRPHTPGPGEEKVPIRAAWEVGHRLLGVALLACGFWQMYEGIRLYSAKYGVSEANLDSMNIVYWVWIGIMTALITLGGGYFKYKKMKTS